MYLLDELNAKVNKPGPRSPWVRLARPDGQALVRAAFGLWIVRDGLHALEAPGVLDPARAEFMDAMLDPLVPSWETIREAEAERRREQRCPSN